MDAWAAFDMGEVPAGEAHPGFSRDGRTSTCAACGRWGLGKKGGGWRGGKWGFRAGEFQEIKGLLNSGYFADGAVKGVGGKQGGLVRAVRAGFLARLVSDDDRGPGVVRDVSPKGNRDVMPLWKGVAVNGTGCGGEPSGRCEEGGARAAFSSKQDLHLSTGAQAP